MSRIIDLKCFEDPTAPNFIETLGKAHRRLTHSQIRDFYRLVLSHFDGDIDVTTGKEILRSISACISISDYFCNAFIDQNSACQLPFNNTYQNDVFDLLSILLDRDREGRAFNEELVEIFKSRIANRGEKSLNIIARFAVKFNEVDNPAPMLNLLFTEYSRFSRPDTVVYYIRVLTYLVRTFPEFRRDKANDVWERLCAILEEDYLPTHPEVVEAVYDGCASVSDTVKTVSFQFSHARKHITEFSTSVLPLLMVCQLDYDALSDWPFLASLIRLARKRDRKAALVLMRLAEDREVAAKLIQNCDWMETDLPDITYTLRLFLVVFQHADLRYQFLNLREFLVFLKRLIQFLGDKLLFLTLICRILRHAEMTNEFAKDLHAEGVVDDFVAAARAIDEDLEGAAATSAILLIAKLAELEFTKDLLLGCGIVAEILEKKNDNFAAAVTLAIALVRHPPCAKRFRDASVIDLFTRMKKERVTRKAALRFFQGLGDTG
jgi:hypothetical protein